MGLDMYLSKKTYVKNWDHMSEEHRTKITVERNGKPIPHIKPERISYIEEEVGYWRKANAIHRWFVDNVQNEVDDCKEYYVSTNDLKKLLELCEEVLSVAVIEKGQPVVNGITYTSEYPEGVPNFESGRAILNGSEIEKILPTQSGFFFGATAYDEWYLQDIESTIEILKDIIENEDENDGDYYYRSSW